MDEYLEMRELAKKRLSRVEIGQRLGLDRKTMRKYLRKECGPPVDRKRRVRSSLLDPHEGHLRTRMAQECGNGKVLLREIQARGYPGGYTILKDRLGPLHRDERWRSEIRWQAPSGQYAQVDWGHFTAELPVIL